MADPVISAAIMDDAQLRPTAQRIRRIIGLALRRWPYVNTRAHTDRVLLASLFPACSRCLAMRLVPHVIASMRNSGEAALVRGWRYLYDGSLQPMGTATLLVRPDAANQRFVVNNPPARGSSAHRAPHA